LELVVLQVAELFLAEGLRAAERPLAMAQKHPGQQPAEMVSPRQAVELQQLVVRRPALREWEHLAVVPRKSHDV
jgi:hypothetical protein